MKFNFNLNMSKRDKRLIGVLSATVFLMISLLTYGIYVKHQQGNLIRSYERKAETDKKSITTELEKATDYNKVIQEFINNRGNSNLVNSLNEYNSIFSDNDGMIGVLTIPKIDVRLPIYHGTSEETIAKGVGHVSDTAFPMDTVGTKSVLTGHNGMPGADMLFTRLDETKIGDTFVIQIGDVGYHYVVKQMTVITPEEAEVYAQEPINSNDPANVTLITCTPYGINSHRLLVIGEFVKKANVDEDKNIIPQTHFSLGKETIVILFVTTMGLGLIAYVVKKTVDKNKKELNNSEEYDGYEVDDQYWDVD